jgi:aryl-alcohol dehydrogenase-like predicted oxidoreductase
MELGSILLGKSGMRVSNVCLGTMTFGTEWGYGADQQESRRLFESFLNMGGNFFDTANRYTEGSSERILGSLIREFGVRNQVVVATKFSLRSLDGKPNDGGNHRKNMVQSLDASLQRLGMDYVDLFYLHAWDFSIDPEELMYNLNLLVQSGKVLHIALSDVPAWVFSACMSISRERHYAQPVALQGEYSLLTRDMERDMMPAAAHYNVPVLAWGTLAGGAFSGKYLKGEAGRVPENSLRRSDRAIQLTQTVVKLASKLGIQPIGLALAWTLHAPGKLIPIVGARNAEQLEESLQGMAVDIPVDVLAELDAASAIAYGFPHDFLRGELIRQLQFGPQHNQYPIPHLYRQ